MRRSSERGEWTMDLQGAIQEAGRCLLCHDAPCNTGCGADNDPATFIRQLRLGNLKGAVRTMRRNNVLAATCAQVCPTCRLCEQGCARSGIDETIRISTRSRPSSPTMSGNRACRSCSAPEPGDRRVAVVGAGPAGLSAAARSGTDWATRLWSSRRCPSRRPAALRHPRSPAVSRTRRARDRHWSVAWACRSSASTRSRRGPIWKGSSSRGSTRCSSPRATIDPIRLGSR